MEHPTWKDATSYSRGAERILTAWEVRLTPDTRIYITRGHIHYRGEWVVSCYPWFDAKPLNLAYANNDDEAKTLAVELVRKKIDAVSAAIQRIT